jgi:hypothetical protein
MIEYKDVGNTTLVTDDNWQTCKACMGKLSDLNTPRKDTYQDYIKYINENPIEFIESIRGIKLNWLQKIYLRKMFNLK